MYNYWKMNRIGFVNFWLYDEETFDFVDGRLLLRGQNGSGKSITTQSFIPFILDGDRTPSRLDPFGSSDRKMEYYFLGENDRDDSTGYLFLEFKKTESDEYRTIAIGQRARRGKPMDFWGFVILDGRRIGKDIHLYKETGSVKIPYDKQEIRKILGDNTPFTLVPGEYKAMVNQYLFGFQRPEQYEQFIKLLVKVRAPKLSKEFKPTKVYEILNESLQTLTDDELRSMVDAMEKMDAIQESLAELQRTLDDVKKIRIEYSKYNRYMLARKGKSYLDKHDEVEKRKASYEEHEKEIKSLTLEEQEKNNDKDHAQDRLTIIETELVNLVDTDMEEADVKLQSEKKEREEILKQNDKWNEKLENENSELYQQENQIKKINTDIEYVRRNYRAQCSELSEMNKILQWTGHDKALQTVSQENRDSIDVILKELKEFKEQIKEGKSAIEELSREKKIQDELSQELDERKKEKSDQEIKTDHAKDKVLNCQDILIEQFFQNQKVNTEWRLPKDVLMKIEGSIRSYEQTSDAASIYKLLEIYYTEAMDKIRNAIFDHQNTMHLQKKTLKSCSDELTKIQNEKEIEPERSAEVAASRKLLKENGIDSFPFYQTIEFSENMSENDKARLEMQLQMMGILDALIVEKKNILRIKKEFPEWADAVLYVDQKGTSSFDKLVVNKEMPEGIKDAVLEILSNIEVDSSDQGKIFIGNHGEFRNGILFGKAHSNREAEYVGTIARRKKKETLIEQYQQQLEAIKSEICSTENEIHALEEKKTKLQNEYELRPQFTELNQLLYDVHLCELDFQHIEEKYNEQLKRYEECEDRCNAKYQTVLQKCKHLPYGYALQEYQEVEQTMDAYLELFRNVRNSISELNEYASSLEWQQILHDKSETDIEMAQNELHRCANSLKQTELRIHKYEEYLARADIREKAEKCAALREKQQKLNLLLNETNRRITQIQTKLEDINEIAGSEKNDLDQQSKIEEVLCRYFEEELNLRLVISRNDKTLFVCAQESEKQIDAKDIIKEPQDVLTILHRVFQEHSSNLIKYGTTLEDCFEDDDEGIQALRKRVQISSLWNGKKLYLEEFYETLIRTIDETELLIQEKDRELFEDILSRTVGQQLTERIADSRKWVKDMSELMKGMNTSMGLSFSLSWKPKSAENDNEIDTGDLENILLRDHSLLTNEDIERVAKHFRSKIKTAKIALEDSGAAINYMELVRDALDYRKWFEFQMFYKRNMEDNKVLTNAAFNRFSGGEKAMAMYVPLFAAVNAQYKKASNIDHPKMIALDEAFAGVDDKNISSMFELVSTLGFDYIMNSQSLWGCYETVKGLKIADLQRPQNAQVVTVISYIWNGHERILDEKEQGMFKLF